MASYGLCGQVLVEEGLRTFADDELFLSNKPWLLRHSQLCATLWLLLLIIVVLVLSGGVTADLRCQRLLIMRQLWVVIVIKLLHAHLRVIIVTISCVLNGEKALVLLFDLLLLLYRLGQYILTATHLVCHYLPRGEQLVRAARVQTLSI